MKLDYSGDVSWGSFLKFLHSHCQAKHQILKWGSQNALLLLFQCAKKDVADSPGLVDFAIGLVIFVLNLPDGQVLFFGGNSNYRRIVINPANQKGLWG